MPARPAVLSRPVLPFAIIGVLLLALLAGGAVWSATAKTVLLSVDGEPREVDFRGSTVEDVLAAADLEAGERDVVVPALTSEVGDGDRVALRRARQVTLVVDGAEREVWVTATSVDEALDQIGLRDGALALSASRSRELPLDGFRLEVTTPKDIVVRVDGEEKPVTTTETTVGAMLAAAGIAVGPADIISKFPAESFVAGERIQVVRVATATTTETAAVPFATEDRPDPALFTGSTKTLQAGKAGSVEHTVETVTYDGAVHARTVVSSRTLAEPVTRIRAVGTKARPAPAPRAASAPSGGGSAGGLNWAALAQCESGGNPSAVSSTGKYRGLYQFSYATWASVGGSGDPAANSVAEQTHRAQILFNRSGAGQWPHCGPRLFR